MSVIEEIDKGTTPVNTDDGDHERLAHIVVPASAVTEAYMTGTPVKALCGKMWVPSRDAKRYPVCPECEKAVRAAGYTGEIRKY